MGGGVCKPGQAEAAAAVVAVTGEEAKEGGGISEKKWTGGNR